MEKEQFVAVDTEPWWLVQRDVDYRLEDLRQRLGASFGWTDPMWYRERVKFEEVYDFLQQQGSTVFYELDQASDDDRRLRWVESVLELRKPAGSASLGSASPGSLTADSVGGDSARPVAAAGKPANEVPRRKSAFGAKPPSEPPDATPETGTSGPTAPARKSPFGPKGQPEGSPVAVDPDAPAPPDVSAAAPARKSPFGPKRQPAPSGPASQAGTTAAKVDSARTENQVPDLDEEIKTVMSGLSAAELSALADELGLSPEEVEAMVREDDFAQLVAEEQAQLAS
jgi:hypothetical protein